MLAFKVLFEGLGIRHLCLIKERHLALCTVQELHDTTKPIHPLGFLFLFFVYVKQNISSVTLSRDRSAINLSADWERIFNLRFSEGYLSTSIILSWHLHQQLLLLLAICLQTLHFIQQFGKKPTSLLPTAKRWALILLQIKSLWKLSTVYQVARELRCSVWPSTWHKQSQTIATTYLQATTAQSNCCYSPISQKEELAKST